MSDPRPLVLVGGGEHARVIADAARAGGPELAGYADPRTSPELEALGLARLGDDAAVLERLSDYRFLVARGALTNTAARRRLVERYAAAGARWASVVHPSAIVSPAASIGHGVVVLAGAVVNPGARLEDHSIVNTAAVIEHDVTVGRFAHVAPRAAVGGGSRLGEGVYIGLGASVRDHLRIGDSAIVGLGAAVVADVAAGVTVVGVPAKPLPGGR